MLDAAEVGEDLISLGLLPVTVLTTILDAAEGGRDAIAIFGDYIYYYVTKTIKKGFLSRVKETNLVRIKIDGTNKTIL